MPYMYTVHTIQVKMAEADFDGVPDVPLHVINNYFSVGADAQIALLFHNERGTEKLLLWTVECALQAA